MHKIIYFQSPLRDPKDAIKIIGSRIPEKGERIIFENSYGARLILQVFSHETRYTRQGEICFVEVRTPADGSQPYLEFRKLWEEACRDHQSF